VHDWFFSCGGIDAFGSNVGVKSLGCSKDTEKPLLRLLQSNSLGIRAMAQRARLVYLVGQDFVYHGRTMDVIAMLRELPQWIDASKSLSCSFQEMHASSKGISLIELVNPVDYVVSFAG
jgi:hypothetical protein